MLERSGSREGVSTQVRLASPRSGRRRPLLAAVLGVLLLLSTAGCATDDIPNQLSMPDPVTEEGERIFSLWQGMWIAAWVVGLITWALILGAALLYRRRHVDQVPPQTRYNVPIEAMYTITPLIVVAVITLFTWRDTDKIIALSDDEVHTVNVVGYQWNWTFNYTDEKVYDTGSPSDPPTLYLPEGQKVRFILTSPDVVHSFWIPAFLMKMDVVPGRANSFEVTPIQTGSFAGKCAELCGTYHSQMLFNVEVVSPEEYQTHIADLAAAGQTGSLDTGRDSEEAQDQGRVLLGGQS